MLSQFFKRQEAYRGHHWEMIVSRPRGDVNHARQDEVLLLNAGTRVHVLKISQIKKVER